MAILSTTLDGEGLPGRCCCMPVKSTGVGIECENQIRATSTIVKGVTVSWHKVEEVHTDATGQFNGALAEKGKVNVDSLTA